MIWQSMVDRLGQEKCASEFQHHFRTIQITRNQSFCHQSSQISLVRQLHDSVISTMRRFYPSTVSNIESAAFFPLCF